MEINVIPDSFEAPRDIFPFPAPFTLSSVEREWCGFQSNKNAAIVFIKRRHLEENIKALNGTGMDEAERNRFLDYWCSPSTRNPEEIRAEKDDCFNLRQRVTSWMERARPMTQQPQRKTRIEQYAEKSQRLTGLINELFTDNPGPTTDTTVPPDEQ